MEGRPIPFVATSPHNTVATGDKGRVPVLIEGGRAVPPSRAVSGDSEGWILRQAESLSVAASVQRRRVPCT